MSKNFLAVGILVALSIPMGARADALLLGVLNATGTAEISLGSIDFLDNVLGINGPASAQQGGFTALAGTSAAIDNIVAPAAGGTDSVGPLSVPDFVTFAADPNISITLTFLESGIDGSAGCSDSPAAAGQICTPNLPAQSPFNLQDTSATSSSASFQILGLEVDSTTGDTVPVTGFFTTPFTTQSFQTVLGDVLSGETVVTSFSAQFATVAAIPEPGTLIPFTTGIAALGMGLVFRRKPGRN